MGSKNGPVTAAIIIIAILLSLGFFRLAQVQYIDYQLYALYIILACVFCLSAIVTTLYKAPPKGTPRRVRRRVSRSEVIIGSDKIRDRLMLAESEVLIMAPKIWEFEGLIDTLTHLRYQKSLDVKALVKGKYVPIGTTRRYSETMQKLHRLGVDIELQYRLQSSLIVVDRKEAFIFKLDRHLSSQTGKLETKRWLDDPEVVAAIVRMFEEAYNSAFAVRTGSGRE